MLTEGRLTETQLIESIGRPGDIDELAKHLTKQLARSGPLRKDRRHMQKSEKEVPGLQSLTSIFGKGRKGKRHIL